LPDRELAEFYGSLFASEARHHATYVELARLFDRTGEVDRRLEELAAAEAEIIDTGDEQVRVHS
jgi:tRNA-(ms[2]io[6]A)-hydroxylase